MIEGITESGFVFAVDEEKLDDWEMLEMIENMGEGKNASYTKTIKAFLGEEQATELKEHVRMESGRVPASRIFAEFEEIMKILTEESKKVKN